MTYHHQDVVIVLDNVFGDVYLGVVRHVTYAGVASVDLGAYRIYVASDATRSADGDFYILDHCGSL